MSFYSRTAFRLFSDISENLVFYFPDLKTNLKKSRMKFSIQEYLSITILSCFIAFLIQLPIFSFLFGFVFQAFLFSFITAFTVSSFLSLVIFFIFLNYPTLIIKGRERSLDGSLPFASLYLATIAGSKLPLDQIFKIFSKFSAYEEVNREVNLINQDIDVFGLDINTALERSIDRSPSKNFKELLWGILSTVRTGGNLSIYLKEKARNSMNEYRRKLYEFSHQLTVYIEVYLTSIVLGAIFFTILTAIISGIGGAAKNIIFLQFFLIFALIPMISVLFIFLIKAITPGGE